MNNQVKRGVGEMSPNDYQQIRDAIKPFLKAGLIDSGVEEELKSLMGKKAMDSKKDKLSGMMTQKEAIKVLGISRQTIYNLRKRGKIHPMKINGSKLLRYDVEELEKLLSPVED